MVTASFLLILLMYGLLWRQNLKILRLSQRLKRQDHANYVSYQRLNTLSLRLGLLTYDELDDIEDEMPPGWAEEVFLVESEALEQYEAAEDQRDAVDTKTRLQDQPC